MYTVGIRFLKGVALMQYVKLGCFFNQLPSVRKRARKHKHTNVHITYEGMYRIRGLRYLSGMKYVNLLGHESN